MKLETERLLLREMEDADFDALYAIFSDAETMQHYPAPFDAEKVKSWIARNQKRYREDGFGLWTVVLKSTGEIIGDCGITLQNINGEMLPEIGYHTRKDKWRQGFATEGAATCMRYAFEELQLPAVYSYMKYTNAASYGVAIKNGMRFVEEYPDPVNTKTRVYAITREEWLEKRT